MNVLLNLITSDIYFYFWMFYVRYLRNPLFYVVLLAVIILIFGTFGTIRSKFGKTPEDEYYDSLSDDDD